MICEPNFFVPEDGSSFYEQIRKRLIKEDIRRIYVDNAEYLTGEQAEDLFYISKLLDVPVIAYGNRLCKDKKESGINRLLAMADEIKKIGFAVFPAKSVLQFICGPMNCGKSSKLFIEVLAMKQIGLNVRIIKSDLDRTKDCVLSRNGLSMKADLIVDKDVSIYDMVQRMVSEERVDCLFVDEAQFLSKEQVIQLRQVADKFGLLVYCYGLRTDYETKTFSGSEFLLQISDIITLLDTMCECGNTAQFNARYLNGKIVKPGEGEQVVVDNNSQIEYKPICPNCCIEYVIGPKSRKRILKPLVPVDF